MNLGNSEKKRTKSLSLSLSLSLFLSLSALSALSVLSLSLSLNVLESPRTRDVSNFFSTKSTLQYLPKAFPALLPTMSALTSVSALMFASTSQMRKKHVKG